MRINALTPFQTLFAAIGAAFLFTAAPQTAHAHGSDFSIEGLTITASDEEFLQELIDLDAEEIDALRNDLLDVQDDIRNAMSDIDEAREEVRSVPGAGIFLWIALKTASGEIEKNVGEVFDGVLEKLDAAELELADRASALDAAEVDETQGAIEMLREEITNIELALSDLVAAMRA